MDDFTYDAESLEAALNQGFLEEAAGEYHLTEKGLQQLMYHYASNSEYVDLAQRLSEQQGNLHEVVACRVYYLRETNQWFSLVDGSVWITDEPGTLLMKILEYRDMQTQERIDHARRDSH